MNAFYRLLLAVLLLAWAGVNAVAGEPVPSDSEVRRFERDVASAKAHDLHLLAPGHFQKAQDVVSQLKQTEDAAQKADLLKAGRLNLTQAGESGKTTTAILAPALQARNRLLDAGARDYDVSVWELDRKLVELARAAENGRPDVAVEKRQSLAREYENLIETRLGDLKLSTW